MQKMAMLTSNPSQTPVHGRIGLTIPPRTALSRSYSSPMRLPSSSVAGRLGAGWMGVQMSDMHMSDRELVERTSAMLRSQRRPPALHRPFTHHARQGLPHHYGATLHFATSTCTDYRVGGYHATTRSSSSASS